MDGEGRASGGGGRMDAAAAGGGGGAAGPKKFTAYADEITKNVKPLLQNVLDGVVYNADEVPTWVDTITDRILEALQEMSDGYKYIVTVMILQRCNAGFHLFSTCYWDQSVDGTVTVQHDSKSMHCIVSIFGLGQ